MISKDDSQVILQASLYFNELFKKTLMASIPPEVNTKTQMDILVTLYEGGAVNMSSLSKRICIAPEQATRSVKSLREKNLVMCERNPQNRREVIAKLTDSGIALFEDHVAELHRRVEDYLGELTEEEYRDLLAASKKIVLILNKTRLSENVV